MRVDRILAIALVTPLLVTLFLYGAMLQPIRFGPADASRMCYEGPPIQVRIQLYDSNLPVPFAHVRLYSLDGRLVASANTGPGGECSPISGVEPGRYLVVVEGARQMFLDYINVYGAGGGVWKKYSVRDAGYVTLVNYGLLPGRVEVDGLAFEVPPLTAVRVPRSSEYRFEEGKLSLRPVLEPMSEFLWNPRYARRLLEQQMVVPLLLAAAAPLALGPTRRKYAALVLTLFLLGPFLVPEPVIAQEVLRIIRIYEDCGPAPYPYDQPECILHEISDSPEPPDLLVADVEFHLATSGWENYARLVVTLSDLRGPFRRSGSYYYNATLRIEAWGTYRPPGTELDCPPYGLITALTPYRRNSRGLTEFIQGVGSHEVPFSQTYNLTLPYVLNDDFYYELTLGYGITCISEALWSSYVYIYFIVTSPPATNRTAISLVTKFMFKSGFGQDNPIDYRGPTLPRGVEQSITGLEMLPETMFVRQYSMELMQPWAVRGEISHGLVGIMYARPGNIFGLPVPGQDWEVPPYAEAILPIEVVLRGRIRSGYNPFFNQRIPFPFAPYYEFPTILEIPLDHGRPGGSVAPGLENATFLVQVDIDVDTHVFLNPPWTEEGDVVSYVYPVTLVLSGLPFVSKARELFARLKSLPDAIKKVFARLGEPPPSSTATDEIANAAQEGLQNALRQEALSTRVHLDNAPRIPTRSELQSMPPEQRAPYEHIFNVLVNLRKFDKSRELWPKLNEAVYAKKVADKLMERSASYPEGSLARTYMELIAAKFYGTSRLDSIEDVIQTMLRDLTRASNYDERNTIAIAIGNASRELVDAAVEAINELRHTARLEFYAYLDEAVRELGNAVDKIRKSSATIDALYKKTGLEPRVWREDVVYLSLEGAGFLLGLANPAAAAASAIAWVVFYATSLGVSTAHAFIGNRDWQNPYGLAMAGAIAFKVRTPTGIRLAYISVAPNVGFGLFGGGYPASAIVDNFLSHISNELGYGPPAKITGIIGDDPSEVVGVLSTISWSDLDSAIATAVGAPASQIKLLGVAFMPVYIPYTNTAAYRIGKAYVFDFDEALKVIANTGTTASLKAIVPRSEPVDDPNEMLNLMHPVLVNGIQVDRSNWKVVRTRVGSALKDRPILSYPLDVRAVGEQPKLLVETKNKVPFTSVVRVNVTQEFMWDPTTSQGGFGVPCVGDRKYFEGLFQVLSIRFYRYPVTGTSPPDEVVFTVRAENATIRKVYGADILKFDGASFRVPGSSFIWIKVGEDASLGITYWDGELKKGVKLDVFSFVLRCGYGLDVSLGGRDATRGVISGSVRIDGSALQGSATLPTKAIFAVNAYRPPSQPNPPRITAEMVVGYHSFDPEGGPKWIQFWRDVRTFDSFPARAEASIGDLVMAALELANRTGRPVTVRADMVLSGAPPGYNVIQPDPAEWVAVPGPLVGRVWRLNVTVMNASDRARIPGALVTVQNKSHTFNATTDATGVATFSLTTGSYLVRATASGYTPAETTVNLVRDTDVVLMLTKAPSRQATVTVYVYDGHTSAPIQGARVTLDSTEQTTNSDGRAVFANVPFGSYVLQVTKSGYSPYRRTIDVMNDTVRIDVALMQERPKVIATVTVVNARTGAPIAGATVQFENGTMVYTGTTGADGITRITLPIGGYTLRVSASGFYPFSQTVFVPSSGFSTTVRLTPTTEESEPPKPLVPPEECDIPLTTIMVLDATNGAGIPGAHVTLVRGGFTYEGTTDANGEAKFCITSGIYSYRAEKEGYQTVEGTSFIAKGTTFTIAMTPLSEIPSGRLTVIVRDAASTSPIEGAEVTVQNSTHVLRQYTDGNGRAQFVLIAGGYLLTVRKSGYRDFSASLEFPGGDVNYIVSLTPHGLCEYPGNWTEPVPCGYRWLVINVRYRDGFPFAGASVTVSNGTMSVTVTTDGLGIAKFLLSPGTYTVSISASEGARSYSTTFSVNLNQNLWIMRFVTWYSPYFSPEVYPLYATFVGPRRGVWNQEHLVAVGFYSNVPQTITAKVSAINYTKYARDGTVQELASATFTVSFTDSAINSTLLLLNVTGSGVALVAPMVTILSYQNDTFTDNNRLVGDPILFGPMLDVSLRIIVEVDSSPTGALVPEITRMRITVEFWANQEVPVPGRLMLRAHFVSAETGRRLERPLLDESVVPGIDVQNRSVTYYLEWTNVTAVSVSFSHDLEVNEIDNNQTAYIYLDRAIKLVEVRAPRTVRSDSYFYVNITVLSNWWPSWEYGYLAKLGSAAATGSFRAGFGYTNATVYARAPAVSAPTTMELNVTVGPDFAPHDNSKAVTVQVVPETFFSLPWIILLLAMAAIGAGAVATARTARRAQAVYRRRRALRSAGEWPDWRGQDVSRWGRDEAGRRRRRALR